ncbi:MAG: redoxin domain-containing protein [Verrucomicrobia bacterium]|nr:MAG: redoxin domain-containing protein [Verrucomicrobiota bacterium]
MSLRNASIKVYGSLLVIGLIVGVGLFYLRRTSTPVVSTALSAVGYDLEGKPVFPFASKARHGVVLIFSKVDCPNSNRYAPEIRRLHEEYTSRGFKFWVVYPDSETTIPELLKHQSEYQLPKDVLRDPAHALVRLSQVRVTPEAAVFLADGKLVYHGRIDNRHVDFGSTRPEATEHNLRQVLQQIEQGGKVTRSSTTAVGCYIDRIQ